MFRIIFMFYALLALPAAQAGGDAANWLEAGGYTEVAHWMTEQSAAQARAAGLLALAGEQAGNRRIDSGAYLESMRQLLDESAPASALFLLVRGCERLDLADACIEAGLDEAIVRRAGGNPLSRGALYAPKSEEFRDVLLSAERVKDHTAAFASAWHEALIEHDSAPIEQGEALVASISLALGMATPGYSEIANACGEAIGKDEALDKACHRLATQMQQSKMNLLTQSVGYAMARSRAQALGEDDLAAQYAKQNQAVRDEATRLARNAHELLVAASDQREFLLRWRDEGELAALRALEGQR